MDGWFRDISYSDRFKFFFKPTGGIGKINCPCTFKLVVRHNQLSLPWETMPRIKIVKKNDLEIHIEMVHCTVLPRGPVVFATSFMFMSQCTCFLKTIIWQYIELNVEMFSQVYL